MKKNVLIILSLLTISIATQAQDKAFQKGNIVIDAGVGVAAYATLLHTEVATSSGTLSRDIKDNAASAIYPFQAEYGLKNWFGLGARFAYSNYYDSANTESRGLDFDILVNFHLIKTKRFEMPITLILGYSNLKIKYNDAFGTIVKDNGSNSGFMLTPRFYLTDHFGLFINLGRLRYSYPSLIISNSSNTNIFGPNTTVALSGMGLNFGLGLVVKI